MASISTRSTPTASSDTESRRAEIRTYLALLAGTPRAGELLELRGRVPGAGMARRFYPATRPHGLVEAITRLGARGDVYVGCAPRARRAGGRDAIERSWVLWADCDTPEAAAALEAIDPPPTLVVASGSPAGRHSYWALRHPADLDAVEDLNRRLAHQLGSDQQVYDAARILRPPGTHNFKHHPPRPVRIVESRPERRITLDELREAWPPAPEPSGKSPEPTSRRSRRRRGDDRLLGLAPAVYLPVLTGHQVNADGKVPCPLHLDSTASLHAYSDHWFCFGCRRGGTVYDLAAPLFGLDTRGPDFLELRRRLLERFEPQPASWNQLSR